MSNVNVELDNRIYMLKIDENASPQVVELAHQADVAYLQDRNDEAERLIGRAETLHQYPHFDMFDLDFMEAMNLSAEEWVVRNPQPVEKKEVETIKIEEEFYMTIKFVDLVIKVEVKEGYTHYSTQPFYVAALQGDVVLDLIQTVGEEYELNGGPRMNGEEMGFHSYRSEDGSMKEGFTYLVDELIKMKAYQSDEPLELNELMDRLLYV